jgi:precorrin-6B methylase 2
MATSPTSRSAPRWTQDAVLGLSRSFMESRVLLTAAELDLFSLLARRPLSAQQIARQLTADQRALTILLDALAAMGLLTKRRGAWRTEPSAARLLATGSAGSVLPMVRHSAHLWQRWAELTSTVVGHKRAAKATGDWLGPFIGAMHVVAAPIAVRIVSLVQPGRARRLIDVGGASGSYTMAFLRASPELHATLFDRPPVIRLARERLRAEGMAERVTLVAGDFYEDPLPGGHDLAFVSAIIHQNTPKENVALFRKVFAALTPGGRIVVRDHVLSPDRTRPKAGALFAVNMLLGPGGNSYTRAEIAQALTTAGFGRIRLLHPDTRMDGLVEAFRPPHRTR